jgi:aerobic-type carbon monoxide dehydrogenase small subunit (CoxS/CutS family)
MKAFYVMILALKVVNHVRISKHPILDFPEKKVIHFTFNGQPQIGHEGDTIASALHALGFKELSKSIHHKRARGFYCAIGNCGSCHMRVNHVSNIKTCITPLEEGMIVELEEGLGRIT